MFRRYTISIEVSDTSSLPSNGFEKVLGCSISEPSNWVEYGTTTERGLTFLDRQGRELISPVFLHQPFLTSSNAENEIDEIKVLIFDSLAKHYAITPEDIKIRVAEYNRL